MSNNGGNNRGNDRSQPPGERRPMPPSIRPRPAQGGAPAHGDTTRAQPVRRQSTVRPAPSNARRGPSGEPQRRTPGHNTQPSPTSDAPRTPTPRQRPTRGRHRCRRAFVAALVIGAIIMVGAWVWVESKITHVDALSGAPDTPGDTYLIVGSDSREGWRDDGVTGERTDTIILLHKPEDGPTALISIPRDSYVEIPGHGSNKINAAFAFGGAPLLVETVENLSGLTIDRYLEVGFTGVSDVVDALGGVELCHDQDVDDWRSKMEWEAGCHQADGDTALAFARMRYSDPTGDIGRTERQQQLVSAVATDAMSPSTWLNPVSAVRTADAGLGAFRANAGTGAFDLVRAALAFNSARGDDAVTGTPPLASINYTVSGVGSTVLLDPDKSPDFWQRIADGSYEPGTQVGGMD